MSTSASGGRSPAPPVKPPGTTKFSSWVPPGVFDVRARPRVPVTALISDDLPTLDRPASAVSGGPSGGRCSIDGTPRMNCQGLPNSSASVADLLICSPRPAGDGSFGWLLRLAPEQSAQI